MNNYIYLLRQQRLNTVEILTTNNIEITAELLTPMYKI